MKIFVITKNSILLYLLMLAAIFGIYFTGANYGEAILTATKSKTELPIYCVDTPEKKIALTFDAAWGDEDTDALIAVLEENGVKASFFMVGGWIERFPESTKKFHDAGHEILNHSDAHLHMNGLTEAEIAKDLNDAETKIKNTVGESKMLFRAPYGEYNDKVIKSAKDAGFTAIQWDCDSLDWKELSAEEIDKRISDKVKNGSIILMHNGAKNTPAALKIVLPKLKQQGYSFVPVSELIYKDNYKIDNSGKQSKIGQN